VRDRLEVNRERIVIVIRLDNDLYLIFRYFTITGAVRDTI
jgi:hypothetical protein